MTELVVYKQLFCALRLRAGISNYLNNDARETKLVCTNVVNWWVRRRW